MGSSRWRVYFLLGLTAVETVQALALGCVGLPRPGVYLAAWEVTERVCNRVCGSGVILPELRRGPWDMEATRVLGLAHRQDEGDEGNGGCGMGVLGRGDPSAERAN